MLVFPCGSEVGLELYRGLKNEKMINLIGASSVYDHGEYAFAEMVHNVPMVYEDGFIGVIKKIVEEKQIDYLFPAMDSVNLKLKENEVEIGCTVLGSDVNTVRVAVSKLKTYEKLKNYVLTPKLYNEYTEIAEYPVFLKPDIGYGSRGTHIAYNLEEVVFYKNRCKDLMVMEYLPGEEYTIDGFTDYHGNIRYCSARRRNRIFNGISVNATFEEKQDEFIEFAYKVNKAIRFRGAWFIQVKRNKQNKLCLMEISTRIGGTSELSRVKGVNLPLLTLYDAMEVNVDVFENDCDIELDRALSAEFRIDCDYEVVYTDYDDCLVNNEGFVNTELIRFLYCAINKGKKIVLLSKHRGDLEKELKRYRVDSIFDSIIHLDEFDEKYNYIAEKSIFIDDSFSERKKVKEKLDIPVFSPDMVCCLFNKEKE